MDSSPRNLHENFNHNHEGGDTHRSRFEDSKGYRLGYEPRESVLSSTNNDTSTDKTLPDSFPILEDERKAITVFRNGDLFHKGKRVVYNIHQIRSWDKFLQELTQKVGSTSNRAVRNLHTPRQGRLVTKYEDLHPNGQYIAVGMGDHLRLIDYLHEKKKRKYPRNINAVRLDPIVPVIHSNIQADSRFLDIERKRKKVIEVFRNGDEYTPRVFVQLTPLQLENMDRVLKAVSDKVVLRNNRAIRRLYTIEGFLVSAPEQIEEHKTYVAAANEPYQYLNYGQVLRRLVVGRLKKDKWQNIRYLDNMPTPPEEMMRSPRKPLKPIGSTDRSRTTYKRQYPPRRPDGTSSQPYDRISSQEASPSRQPKVNSGSSPQRRPVQSRTKPPEKQNGASLPAVQPKQSQRKTTDQVDADKLAREEAASTIQAHVRGYQTREQTNRDKQSKSKRVREETSAESVDNYPYHQAATTIQAGYKGYKTRKQIADGTYRRQSVQSENEQKEESDTKPTQEEEKAEEPDTKPNQDEEKAATKIQSHFRGYQTRKAIHQANSDSTSKKEPSPEEEKAATRIQASFRGYQTRKNLMTNKSEVENHDNDSAEKENAVIKIQSSFRGYQTRKELHEKSKRENEAATKIQSNFRGYQTRKYVLKDEELEKKNAAATKIQSSFRGYQTRKYLTSEMKDSNDLDDEEFAKQNEAATRIQANFRGYQTRKHLSEQQ